MGQSIKAWIGLSAVVALLVAGAGWLLFISPTRAATADTRANEQSEQDRAIVLTKALDTLKAQFADLDASRVELDSLKQEVPDTAGMAEFRRMLNARALENGVTILSISTGVSTTVDPNPAPVAPAPATDTANADGATPAPTLAAEAAVPTAPVAPTIAGQLLVGVPLEVTVVGPYGGVRAFIASLQKPEGRLFLVSGLGLLTQLDSPAGGGRPETVSGDVQVTVQGQLLVLTKATTDPPDVGEVPAPLPLPTTERNPFAPVVSAAPAG